MRSLFEFKRHRPAILAPLGPQRPSLRRILDNLPPAAAPIAVTLGGGVALVVVLGLFLSRQDAGPPSPAVVTQEQVSQARPAADAPAEPEQAAAPDPEPEPEPEPMRTAALGADLLAPFALPDGLETMNGDAGPATAAPAPSPPASELTASIPRALVDPDRFEPDLAEPAVPVAETEEELLALEAIQMREVEADLAAPSDEQTAAIAPSEATVPMRAATATRYVNMRAGPDDDAQVLMVVPALAEIEAEADCGWCAVSYDGRSGFIYRTFISYRD